MSWQLIILSNLTVLYSRKEERRRTCKDTYKYDLTGDYFNIVNFITDIRNDERILISTVLQCKEKRKAPKGYCLYNLNAYIVS